MTDNLKIGDKVAVDMHANGTVDDLNADGTVDVLLDEDVPGPVCYIPVKYVTRTDLPVRPGDTWKLDGKLYQAYTYSGSLRVRQVSSWNSSSWNSVFSNEAESTIAEFEAAGPELVFRPDPEA